MDEITKYIKKMLKDVGDMLDTTTSMVKNPKAVSALKASISSLLIIAGGLYAGTQIHQAVNPVPETEDSSVMLEDLEEPDRIPSNNPMKSVVQTVVEEEPSEPMPMQSVDQKAVEEEPMQSTDQTVFEPLNYYSENEDLEELDSIPSNNPMQSVVQTVVEEEPSEPIPFVDQEVYEHYKPGLSVGDSCDITNKCSDKRRKIEEIIDIDRNIHLTTTFELLCKESKCVESPKTTVRTSKPGGRIPILPNYIQENYKSTVHKNIGESCVTSEYDRYNGRMCHPKKRTVFQVLADDAGQNTHTVTTYGLSCIKNHSSLSRGTCRERVVHSCKCSNKIREVEEFKEIGGKPRHIITTYRLTCSKDNPECVETPLSHRSFLPNEPSNSNSVGIR